VVSIWSVFSEKVVSIVVSILTFFYRPQLPSLHTHTHTYTHTHMYTHIHTYTHTLTHTKLQPACYLLIYRIFQLFLIKFICYFIKWRSSLSLCYLTVECSTFEMSEIRGGSPLFYCTVRRFLRERIGGRVIMLF
jgi:hypothetical protein